MTGGGSNNVASFGGTSYIGMTLGQTVNTHSCTFAAWVRPATSASTGATIWGTNGDGIQLQLASNGRAELWCARASCRKTTSGSRLIKDDRWHHLLAAYSSSNVKLYIDGVLAFTSSGAAASVDFTGTCIHVGRLVFKVDVWLAWLSSCVLI